MQWTREQYLDYMTFRGGPRPMFVELFGLLVGLDDEWRRQGASPEELDLTAFDFDFVPAVPCGGHCGPIKKKPVVLEETAEYRIERDYLGRTAKLIKSAATIALPMDFPVKSMDDWLALKPLFTFNESRIDWPAVDAARRAQTRGSLVVAGIPGAFDMPRELMGEEIACLSYYEQPELMADILQTISDTSFEVLDRISRTLTIDLLTVHEDFAGRSGPLVGPRQITEHFRPYYRRIWEMLGARRTRIFDQDSDGNINSVLDDLLDCGLTCIHPAEPAAGMDIVQIRKKYGQRLSMAGGIDKHVLRRTKPEIRAELEYKLQPLMRQGGVAFGLDHRIPDGTPLDHYWFYVNTAREILGIEPLDPTNPKRRGWRKMAF